LFLQLLAMTDTTTPYFAHQPTRRRWLLAAAGAALMGAHAAGATPRVQPLVQVWKDPNCGCCKDCFVHLEQSGFQVQVFDKGNNAARARLGMPQQFASCHTGLVQGYVIEGHVPAADIRRLLADKPQALGLAVPGMPVGSPGMDGPEYGGRRDPYQVLLVQKNGSSRVFKAYT
jgi:hypothetical protein